MIAKVQALKRRHLRIRKVVSGTSKRPRLVVYRSLKTIYGHLIDDTKSKTLFSFSSLKLTKGNNMEKAQLVGEKIAKKALELGIKSIIFDGNGYKYHGKVKAVAEGARSSGLKF